MLNRLTTSPSESRLFATLGDLTPVRFHMLLIPTSAPHNSGHYHRIIEVGKKKLPDPGARHQVIWGLVGAVGTDKDALKKAFGAYSYETKTRGERAWNIPCLLGPMEDGAQVKGEAC